jgi:hypothetical protein
MAGIWVKEGNGLRVDMSVLDPIISRVESKVEVICDPADDHYYRWKDALKLIKVSGDYKLLTAYEKFISDENSDPRHIDCFISSLRGPNRRFYRSLESMTMEHFNAYWMVRNTMYSETIRSRSASRQRQPDYRPMYLIVFNDPSKARIMRSIIEARGVIDAKTMRGILSGIDSSAPMLADGLL